MKPRAEPRRGFFDERPPHAPFARILRRDPFTLVFRIRDAAWSAALREMPLRPGDWLLDAGGADGVIADRMHALRGVRTVCVDLAMHGLREARAEGIDVRPVRSDATVLPFADGTFAGAISFETFEHLADWRPAVAELVRVTRRDGHIVASAVSARWRGTWNWCLDRASLDIHSYADHDPSRFVEPSALRRAFEDAGASVLEVRELNAFGTLIFDEAVMLGALVADRGPAALGRPFLAAASAIRRIAGPPLLLSELPWRLLSRSNSVLVVARRR